MLIVTTLQRHLLSFFYVPYLPKKRFRQPNSLLWSYNLVRASEYLGILTKNPKLLPMPSPQNTLFHQHSGRTSEKSAKDFATRRGRI